MRGMDPESKSADMRHNVNDSRSEYSKVQRNRNIRNGLIFIAPNFIGFSILVLIPVLTLFYTSFTKWSALGDPEFNGLKNWRRMFTDESFLTATGNTLLYAAVHIPLTLAFAFALAVLLNSKIKGRAFFRTVAFFPYITAIVAVAQVWSMMFDAKSGIINQFLGLFTNNPPGWLSDTHWAMVAVIIVGTWREVGYFMILLLAGLQTIPSELYEAAEVDGGQRVAAVLEDHGTMHASHAVLRDGDADHHQLESARSDIGHDQWRSGNLHTGIGPIHISHRVRARGFRLRLDGLADAVLHLPGRDLAAILVQQS